MNNELNEGIRYLEEYSRILNAVRDEAAVFEQVLGWQFENRGRAEKLQRKINDLFFPHPNSKPFHFRPENPPTPAVGSLQNIVIIAANPGFGKGNAAEINSRSDIQGNRNFCSEFFTTHADHSKDIDWWKRAVAFAYEASTGCAPGTHLRGSGRPAPAAQRFDELWSWAGCGNIGAIDLIPFHSPKDGLTGTLLKVPRADKARDLRQALAKSSEAAIEMTLKLEPRLVVVGSPSGAVLAERAANSLGWTRTSDLRCHTVDSGAWPHEHMYLIHHWKGPKTSLLTVDGQLFSKQGGLDRVRKALPKLIYDYILSGCPS